MKSTATSSRASAIPPALNTVAVANAIIVGIVTPLFTLQIAQLAGRGVPIAEMKMIVLAKPDDLIHFVGRVNEGTRDNVLVRRVNVGRLRHHY